MPPELLPQFPEKDNKKEKYKELFDGQCWKVSPEDYDYEISEMKAFISHMKVCAKAQGFYLRMFITVDDHVILQIRTSDYVPRTFGGRKKKVKE
jgi:hypothetical protein